MALDGIQAIENMKPGAMVLTHNGVFREVSKIHSRDYVGELVRIEAGDSRDGITCTPNHRVVWRLKALLRRKTMGSIEKLHFQECPKFELTSNLVGAPHEGYAKADCNINGR